MTTDEVKVNVKLAIAFNLCHELDLNLIASFVGLLVLFEVKVKPATLTMHRRLDVDYKWCHRDYVQTLL